MKSNMLVIVIIWIAIGSCSSMSGQPVNPPNESDPTSIVRIDEKLGQRTPLDLKFSDEAGKPVSLRQLINKPTLLGLVYYRCPTICGPMMEGIAQLADEMKPMAGQDYNIVLVSFDETETPSIAAEKKSEYMGGMTRAIPPDSWRFLTGDKNNIEQLANAVGFHYQRLETGFNHPTTLIVLGSDGKISRYIRGITYTPSDVEMALKEAAKGEVGATRPGASMSRSLMALCFYYNSETGTYIPNITRIAGLIILICAAIFVIVFLIRKTKKSQQVESYTADGNRNDRI